MQIVNTLGLLCRKYSSMDNTFVCFDELNVVSCCSLKLTPGCHYLFACLGMDISCDLIELGRTNVAVVCAGVKSILDIGLTLEFLV
jgi:hypothetical protein